MIKKCTRCGNENYNPSDVCMHCALIIEKGGGITELVKMLIKAHRDGNIPEHEEATFWHFTTLLAQTCNLVGFVMQEKAMALRVSIDLKRKKLPIVDDETIAACCGFEITRSKQTAAREYLERHIKDYHCKPIAERPTGRRYETLPEKLDRQRDDPACASGEEGPSQLVGCRNCAAWGPHHFDGKKRCNGQSNREIIAIDGKDEYRLYTEPDFYCANFKEKA